MARVKIELPESFPFSTEIPVRITDINYGQHLGNDALLALLQEARVRYLAHHGLSEKDAGGGGLLMVDATLTFMSEVFYGATLVIEVGVAELSRAGCTFLYRVTDQKSGQEVARARTGIVFFDYSRRRVVSVPDRFRATMAVN